MFETESTLAFKVGLTYDEYWCGEFEILYYYSKGYLDKCKTDYAEQDTLAWMTGSYVLAAIGAAFSDSKKADAVKYPDSPIFYPEIDARAKEKQEERKIQQFHNNLLAAAAQLGKLEK